MFAPTVASAFFLLALAPLASAADFSSYRGLKLGMSLAAASKAEGAVPGDALVVHKRPALLQELHWRPGSMGSDSVQEAVLSFLNGELSRIVVIYDRYRVEGLTSQDMIDGISKVYGSPSQPKTDIPMHSIYGETVPVIARWAEADSSWNLVRTSDGASFALVGFSSRLDALSQTASAEADRLDAAEAPQREAARQSKRETDENAALEKARTLNKPGFRP